MKKGPRHKDWTGARIGVFTVVRELGIDANSTDRLWLAKCDCGEMRKVRATHFSTYQTKTSCNCKYKNKSKKSWSGQRGRCRSCDAKLSPARYFHCSQCVKPGDEGEGRGFYGVEDWGYQCNTRRREQTTFRISELATLGAQ